MKNNPALRGLLITLGITLACYMFYVYFLYKNDSYLITNPTDELLKVMIDDTEYSVAPGQYASVKLRGGEHRMSFTHGGKSADTLFNITRANAVINPTKADYYVFTRPYGVHQNVDSIFSSNFVTIGENQYYGDVKHYNDMYIQDFYYNLDQEFPKVFIRKGEDNDRTNLSKIFSRDEFRQFYFENYE